MVGNENVRVWNGACMTPRAATKVALAFCFASALALPSPAAADEVGWNPFLFTPACSVCGPLTPLTLEQADGVDVILTDFLGPLVGPPVFADEPGPPIGAGGSPTLFTGGPRPTAPGGQIPTFVGPPSGPGGGSGGNGPGGGDSATGGGNAGGGNSDSLPYDITVHDPPGHNNGGNGPEGPHDDVIFSVGGEGPLNLSDTSGDTPDGQAGETLVPEPTTLLLLGSGLSAAAFRRRRATYCQRQ